MTKLGNCYIYIEWFFISYNFFPVFHSPNLVKGVLSMVSCYTQIFKVVNTHARMRPSAYIYIYIYNRDKEYLLNTWTIRPFRWMQKAFFMRQIRKMCIFLFCVNSYFINLVYSSKNSDNFFLSRRLHWGQTKEGKIYAFVIFSELSQPRVLFSSNLRKELTTRIELNTEMFRNTHHPIYAPIYPFCKKTSFSPSGFLSIIL